MSLSGHSGRPAAGPQPEWVVELRTLEPQAWARSSVTFHGDVLVDLVIQPRVNRVAEHR